MSYIVPALIKSLVSQHVGSALWQCWHRQDWYTVNIKPALAQRLVYAFTPQQARYESMVAQCCANVVDIKPALAQRLVYAFTPQQARYESILAQCCANAVDIKTALAQRIVLLHLLTINYTTPQSTCELIPVSNTIHWTNFVLVLAQRLWRWANIKTTMGQYVVLLEQCCSSIEAVLDQPPVLTGSTFRPQPSMSTCQTSCGFKCLWRHSSAGYGVTSHGGGAKWHIILRLTDEDWPRNRHSFRTGGMCGRLNMIWDYTYQILYILGKVSWSETVCKNNNTMRLYSEQLFWDPSLEALQNQV